jgi:hypothetical protein
VIKLSELLKPLSFWWRLLCDLVPLVAVCSALLGPLFPSPPGASACGA